MASISILFLVLVLFSICFACCILRFRKNGIEVCSFFMRAHPLRICTVRVVEFVIMYYSNPIRLANSNKEIQNLCQFFNVICEGSPSRMRRVRRISLGITTRPKSSIRRTIPVAFIAWHLLSGRPSLLGSWFCLVSRMCRRVFSYLIPPNSPKYHS